MKTAEEWRNMGLTVETIAGKAGGHLDNDDVFIDADFIEAIQADARAEGRREAFAGLQFAIDGLEHIVDGGDCLSCAANVSQAQYLRDALRKLIEVGKGGEQQ